MKTAIKLDASFNKIKLGLVRKIQSQEKCSYRKALRILARTLDTLWLVDEIFDQAHYIVTGKSYGQEADEKKKND